jgi:hypothetical protein
VQSDAANYLHVEMAQANCTLADLTHHGEGFREDLVQAFLQCQTAFDPISDALAKFIRFGTQFIAVQLLVFGFKRVDLIDESN